MSRVFFRLMAAVALTSLTLVHAQTLTTAPLLPLTKPIRLVVPYAPGGPIDVTARALAERVKDSLGTVIIDNKPGAGGNLGVDIVAKAPADGYTIGIAAVATHAINPWLFSKMPFNVANDFVGITQMVRVPKVLVMNADTAQRLKINNLADLITYAKANPGKLNVGSGGNGSAGHLAAEMFKRDAGIFVVHIPYNGGNPAQLALLSGQVDFNFDNLATAAATEAVTKAGISPSEVGAVIIATISNTVQTPSMAALVADRIGATPAAAYDISAACAGFCYGIAQADALVRSGAARYVVVVGAEKLSDIAKPTDRTISFLLGDGAGAVVIGPADEPGISSTVWGSDGGKWDSVGMDRPLREAFDDPEGEYPTLRQDGQAVFRWAVWEMAKVAQQALDDAGITSSDLAAFIPHQANMRIINEFAKQLEVPESVVIARDIETTGNTSAASVPLAMHRVLDEHPELSGGYALIIGFGAGLVYAAQIVRLP